MATKETKAAVNTPVEQSATTAVFTKEKLLTTSRYKNRADLLTAILEQGKTYTFKEVDETIDKFLNSKEKVK